MSHKIYFCMNITFVDDLVQFSFLGLLRNGHILFMVIGTVCILDEELNNVSKPHLLPIVDVKADKVICHYSVLCWKRTLKRANVIHSLSLISSNAPMPRRSLRCKLQSTLNQS